MSSAEIEVRHDEARRRFVAALEGGREAVLEYAWTRTDTLDLRHTYVPPERRGRGIASRLAAEALDYAEAHGYKVLPSCPFVAAFIQENPKYRALVAS